MEPSTSRRMPLTRMRKAVVKTVTASAAVPQFALERSANLTALGDLRAALRARGDATSFSDAIIAACARALRKHPQLNASFDEDAILVHDHVHAGLALALEDGLVAPAIMDADRRSLGDIASERTRLTSAAREGRLTPVELLSATFTISNLGPLGVDSFQALVTPPQAAVLAIGRAREDASVSLVLSCDHRVVDGAPAASFLVEVATLLEEPKWLTTL